MKLEFGYASETGPREHNEDFGGFVTPDAAQATTKGVLAAVADGVSGGVHGREAAETAVRNLLADYYATPDTWEIPHAFATLLAAINRWLAGQTASRREAGGMATTLTALALRGRRYHYAHVGDSRLYRLRGEHLEQLTTDHVWEAPGMSHVLKRALGLDTHVMPDFGDGELLAGDRFLLASDGVWEPLGQQELHRLMQLHEVPEFAANALVREAHGRGGQDNASALVVRVLEAGAEDDAAMAGLRDLPLPGRLNPGARLDDFIIEALLHESRATLLYGVRHAGTGQKWVVKTLQPVLAGDREAADRLLMEEWLGKRVQSHYFAEVLPLPARNFLYFAQSWHEGVSLQQRLDAGQHFTAAEVATLGIRLMKALGALHRLDILHRDIKPANLHLDSAGKLRLLDLGVAHCPACPRDEAVPGTPSFLAPELFVEAVFSPRTDLYAAGVTLYHLLTRKYPYGEVEPFQHPRFGDPAPPSRYRPDIPPWLENILLKACARNPEARFETAEEFLVALERGEAGRLARPRPSPAVERDPVRFWQGVALVALVFNLLLVYLLLAG
jgi:protein phosphatase